MSETDLARNARAAIRRAFPAIKLRRLQSGQVFKGRRRIVLGEGGWPDLVWFHKPALMGFIEWKRPGEKPDPEQLKVHADLRAMGFRVEVCEDIPAAIAVIRLAIASGRRAA